MSSTTLLSTIVLLTDEMSPIKSNKSSCQSKNTASGSGDGDGGQQKSLTYRKRPHVPQIPQHITEKTSSEEF